MDAIDPVGARFEVEVVKDDDPLEAPLLKLESGIVEVDAILDGVALTVIAAFESTDWNVGDSLVMVEAAASTEAEAKETTQHIIALY